MPEQRRDPSLFDEVEPDGTRTTGIFRATPPTTKVRRRTPLPPPPPPPEAVDEIVRRWEARVAAARARAEEGTDRA